MNKNIPTAIFIDGDWLYAATKRIDKKINYTIFFNLLMDSFGTNTKIYFYGAINSADKRQVKFYASLRKIGYRVSCAELVKRNDAFVSKGLEIQLSVDAMQRLQLFKKFVLVSGDSDFAPLLKKITDNHIDVLIISLPFTTGYQLRKIARGAFLNLETLINHREDIKKSLILKKATKEKILAPNSLYIQKGDCFDSYIFIKELILSAKNNITIIDNYIDDQILTMVKLLKPEINLKIFTSKPSPADFFIQVAKLREEGRLITIFITKDFHDRFIGIDDEWWHSGHSFKDLGKGASMLSKVSSKDDLDKLNASIIRIVKAR